VAGGFDAWCESCQSTQALTGAPGAGARCGRCGAPLAAWPRFVELLGELQHLDAVLAAWAGEAGPLATLLPERPRFLTDLTPPASQAGDPAPLRDALAAVARGDWRGALAAPTTPDPRLRAARAIAHERLGERAAAIADWDAVLAAGEDARARLARGALQASAGRLAEAGADLERAGDSAAARWDRAAWQVHEAVRSGAGAPEPARLARARAEAGEASSYWSDPTVGRLLWTLLVERAIAARAAGASADGARALLRQAESEFEHETFWDRAMRIVGWTRTGAPDQAERIAAPLARECADALLAEPALAGAALAEVANAVTAARAEFVAGDPAAARRALAGALARTDLRRFRIPCARCGRGSIGVEETT